MDCDKSFKHTEWAKFKRIFVQELVVENCVTLPDALRDEMSPINDNENGTQTTYSADKILSLVESEGIAGDLVVWFENKLL